MHNLDEKQIRIRTFIDANISKIPDYLAIIKKEANVNDVPIIMDDMRDVLLFLLRMKKPKKILELGTAVGYSTLIISEYVGKNATIDTVENYKKRIIEAKKNFENFDKYKKIKLYEEDISDFLLKKNSNIESEDKYDLVFLDAAKAQYSIWLPSIKKLMKKNSILLADNLFKDLDILESRYTIRKRDRTIHKRMREYIYEISHDKELDTYILSIGDGISISVKI